VANSLLSTTILPFVILDAVHCTLMLQTLCPAAIEQEVGVGAREPVGVAHTLPFQVLPEAQAGKTVTSFKSFVL
jgi:hypothetical protein